MKKLIFAIMGMMVVMGLISCEKDSSYDEASFKLEKNTPNDEPKDTKDTIPTWNGDWGTPVKNTLLPYGEPEPTTHMWHGIQVFYRSQNDSLVKTVEMPVGYSLTPSEGFSYSKTAEKAYYTGQSVFSALASNTSYGEWEEDKEGNMRRQVRNTFSLPTSEFSKTLILTHYEAYSTVNGRQHNFLHHVVSAQFVSLDSISGKEVEANDSIYRDVTYELTATAKFTQSDNARAYKNYVVKARHTVRSFVKMKENATTPTKADPCDWKFVAANLIFDPNVKFTSKSTGSFAKCIVLKNTVTRQWALAITSSAHPELYDFQLYKFSFDEFPENWKIDSGIWNNRWEPAHISGLDPWYYEGKSNNKGMTQQEAELNGIKNFKDDKTAENTPYLNWTSGYASDGSLEVKTLKNVVVFSIK